MAPLRLSVVLITWNEKDTLCTCLETVLPALDSKMDEIIVVDNGSRDGTDEIVQSRFPTVRYVKLDRNIGVGPARNRGIALAKGRYAMTLDNDTRVLEGHLGEQVERIFREHPDIGLFSFRLLNEDGTVQRNTRRFPNLLQPIFARISCLRDSRYGRRNLGYHYMEDVDLRSVHGVLDVDYVLGANQVFRKQTFERLGGYDEKIFFGPEDAEFCLRVRRLNLRICFVPDVSIEHAHRRRTRRFGLLTLRHLFGYYYVFWKERTLWQIKP
jgi:GT2 family glycosyltransferase